MTAAGSAPESLDGLVERLRALQSAWGVLAPSCLSAAGREIVEVGRGWSQELDRLAGLPGAPEAASLDQAREGLDALARSLCAVAFEIPVPQLRSTLPGSLREDRRGVLDLLDALALSVFEEPETLPAKLSVIDYLITLLCTGGDPQGRVAPLDPVLLTPILQELCARAESEYTDQLAEIEAAFFSAANLESDLGDEIQVRELRSRKASLGRSYFAPGMLRAIVTYNVALRQSVASEVDLARDWGSEEVGAATSASSSASTPAESVFESGALREVHAALGRRFAKDAPEASPIGRVAWGLSLDALSPGERETLREGSLCPEQPRVAILLVGLLCRSLNVLAIELQAIGIEPDHVSEHWVGQLDELLKGEVGKSIAASAFEEACELSELRNKYLYAPRLDVYREARAAPAPAAPSAASEARRTREEARALASEALAEATRTRPRGRAGETRTWRDWPWRLVAPAAACAMALLALGLHHVGWIDLLQRDLDRWSRSELAAVSPHLAHGHRNGGGAGIAFVGTLEESWHALPMEERAIAAEQLVAELRSQGVGQVMIYDEKKRLRIQALGDEIRAL